MSFFERIEIPGYRAELRPDFEKVGRVIHESLKKHLKGREIVVRAITLADHPRMTREKLEQEILNTGTDKYDPGRKMIFHDFYSARAEKVDFFGSEIVVDEDPVAITDIVEGMYDKALGDRGYPIKIDFLLIYDPAKLEMVEHVYDDQKESDVYIFKDPEHKKDALFGLISIS